MCNVYCSGNIHFLLVGSDINDLDYCRQEISEQFRLDDPSSEFYSDHGFQKNDLIRIVSVDRPTEPGEIPEYQRVEGYVFPMLVGIELLPPKELTS